MNDETKACCAGNTGQLMARTAVIDIVGLSSALIGEHTPFLKARIAKQGLTRIQPMAPGVTTSVQSTYLTGKWPTDHGIVANGWYDRTDSEIKFWKQSNPLVQAESIWTRAKRENSNFTCAQMFWWYNMYTGADFSITPRPNYLADGRKMADCYSHPASLRDEVQEKFGTFPLFQFWGPGANVVSSRWIANASKYVEEKHSPTLSLVYLPHLDYCQQKVGPTPELIAQELKEIDELVQDLVTFYEARGVKVLLLSEYGIVPVNRPVHINRLLRNEGLLGIRVERGLELLDAGASQAFAVADHQVAHIYTRDEATKAQVKVLLTGVPGIAEVWDTTEKIANYINHERAGDLVVMAEPDSWFTYYFWLDDAKAPDYARAVDIHKKPGYDPVEMFLTSKLRAAWLLLKKKLGFRYAMDVIPLDATLVKGSHGSNRVEERYQSVLIGAEGIAETIEANEVHDIIWQSVFGKPQENNAS